MSLKIGALFAGYGGLDLAVSSVLDAEPAWFSEFDKGPSKILDHRFPGIPNHGDITRIDWGAVEPVDIITGGSPCQDLSHAGRRAGMTEGTRSNLWVAMREAIAQLRPSLVVWENVRGAYSAAADSAVEPCPGCVGDGTGVHLRALGRVLGDLSDLGYDAVWHGLRAADVGAPHGRFRVFVVAYPKGDAGRFAYGDGATAAIAADLGHQRPRGARDGRAGPADGDIADVAMLPTPQARDHKGYGPADGERHDPNLSAIPFLLPTPDRWGDYAPAIARWERALGRPAPAPTQTSKKGNPQLAAPFVEWLMGLPSGWVTDVPGITRNEAIKALGNGVVPQQAAQALRVALDVIARGVAA